MDSPSISNPESDEQQALTFWARNLFAASHPAGFLAFVKQIYVQKALDSPSPGSEARRRFDFCVTEHPNSVVLSLLMHLESSRRELTRLRCAHILRHILRPWEQLFHRLSRTAKRQVRAGLIRCLEKEDSLPVSLVLLEVVCRRGWSEAYEYLFPLLKSDKERGLFLFKKSAFFGAEVYFIHADCLREVFRGIMDQESEDLYVRVAAVGAAVELVLCFATPATYDKYYGLFICMMKVLSDVVIAHDDWLTQMILKHLKLLACSDTRFLMPHINFIVQNIAEIVAVSDEAMISLFAFIAFAEDDYGCGMIQNLCPVLLKRLFVLWLDRLNFAVEGIDAPNGNAEEIFGKFMMTLRQNVVIQSSADFLSNFLQDADWKQRYAAITALGIIADKASFGISEILLEAIKTLWTDQHVRVRWATIRAAGQFSKNLGPQAYENFLTLLLNVLEDFENPDLQIIATSTLLLFSKNCYSDIFRTHLERVFDNLCAFLERGNYALRKEALTLLASLIDSFQAEFQKEYIQEVPFYHAVLQDCDNSLIDTKTLECLALVGVVVGKRRFMTNADRIIEMLEYFDKSYLQYEVSMRCCLLQIRGRLCKCLGKDFVPYLDASLGILLGAVFISDADDMEEDGSAEKIVACDVFRCFAEELDVELLKYVFKIMHTLVPYLRCEYNTRLKTAAISAIPHLLHSASSALMKQICKGPWIAPIKRCGNDIFSALSAALGAERDINICMKILEALYKCFELSELYLDNSRIEQFFDSIAVAILNCSCITAEANRRYRNGLDQREVEKDIEMQHNIYRLIANCLTIIVSASKKSIFHLFDKLVPNLALMNIVNSSEERRIFLQISHVVAEHCREEAFRHFEKRLLSMLNECDLQNPDVCEIVAHGIAMCAEFGGSVFKRNSEVIITSLESILKSPKALNSDCVVAHATAVLALGKICHHQGYKCLVGLLTNLKQLGGGQNGA